MKRLLKALCLFSMAIMIACSSGCGLDNDPYEYPDEPLQGDWRAERGYAEALNGDQKLLYSITGSDMAFYYDDEVQTLYGSADFPNPLEDLQYSNDALRLADINFDGYPDLYVPYKTEYNDVYGYCFLWDNELMNFVYNKQLSETPNLNFSENEMISAGEDESIDYIVDVNELVYE